MTAPSAIFPGMSRPLNLRDIFLLIPEQALGLVGFYQSLMRGPSPLSAGERELIYAYGSRAAGCHFCYTSHSCCAVELGIPEAVFRLAPDALDAAPLRPGIAPLLRYTTALILAVHEGAAPRPEAVAVRGQDRDRLIDAILVAGLTAYINRVIEGLAAFSPDDQHARNGLALARSGYLRVREEVARSLADAQLAHDTAWPEPAETVPDELESRADLFRWLKAYQRLVFEAPSGVPVGLRRQILSNGGAAAEDAGTVALVFARRLVRAPRKSTADDVRHLSAAGWSQRDIVDLVIAAATTAFSSRLEAGLRECGVSPAGFPVLSDAGHAR